MAGRRQKHEDHVNHEAWAIPYGDLVTLLLAFFVVMYAISSVNEGKFRVLADALSSAFGGPPRTISPIQLGATQLRGSSFDRPSMQTRGAQAGPSPASPIASPVIRQMLDMPTFGKAHRKPSAQDPTHSADKAGDGPQSEAGRARQLHALGSRIQEALSELVQQRLVTVRRGPTFLEVEIQSDILFASGVAVPSPLAMSTTRKLAQVLRDEPNAVRVEGYTDNVPIRTLQFPSNWELSTARAASVVHVLVEAGVAPRRLAVVGFGEHQPIHDNTTVQGRNANRRVLLVILASPQGPDSVDDAVPAIVADLPDGGPADAADASTRPAEAAMAARPMPPPAQGGVHAQGAGGR